MPNVTSFQGFYRFLSNFSPASIRWQGRIWPTVEHAYQASKTLDLFEQEAIRLTSEAGAAKRLGRGVTLRPDWFEVRLAIMAELVSCKFDQHPDLKAKLLATGDAQLVEGNRWHDGFWGTCRCGRCPPGQNRLGRILMAKRKEYLDG